MSDGTIGSGGRAEIHATVEIVRAETGKVEYYDLVGFADVKDLEALLAEHGGALPLNVTTAGLSREVAQEDLVDQSATVDQGAVTSSVTVDGLNTVRTYSDGATQRNSWATEEEAQAFAASVNGG